MNPILNIVLMATGIILIVFGIGIIVGGFWGLRWQLRQEASGRKRLQELFPDIVAKHGYPPKSPDPYHYRIRASLATIIGLILIGGGIILILI